MGPINVRDVVGDVLMIGTINGAPFEGAPVVSGESPDNGQNVIWRAMRRA